MIKYIASDLDGTLLQNGAQKPDNETLELIRRLTEAGIHFIAASGRQYINMYRMFGPVQDMISYVSENGALVMVSTKPSPKALLTVILSFASPNMPKDIRHATASFPAKAAVIPIPKIHFT